MNTPHFALYEKLGPLSSSDITMLIRTSVVLGSLKTIKYLTRGGIPSSCDLRWVLNDIKRLHSLEMYHNVTEYFLSKGYDPTEIR